MQQSPMMEFGAGPSSQKLASGRIISDGSDMISGKWINRQNGDVILVRGSITDDANNMILLTDKGQISMTEFSKFYIQASDEEYDESGNVIDTKPLDTNEVSLSIDNTPLQADSIYGGNPMGYTQQPTIKNFDLIDKIFKKVESKPNADLRIDWADFPEKELSMLVNYFDVNVDEIAEYIGKYLINEDLLKEALSDFLLKNMKEIK